MVVVVTRGLGWLLLGFFQSLNSTFLTYKSIMLSSCTEWPIPTLSPLSLSFHAQDCLFLSLIPSLCLFISAILSSSLCELHHPASHSSHQFDFILLQIYTVLLDFKIIYPLLLFSYIVFPNSLVHCIFTLHEDVVSNFFCFYLLISVFFQFLI